MKISPVRFRPAPRRQRGVVLFVALIAMVILSLAGVALMRSIEVSSGVAGNLAFRQASIVAVNEAIEQSVNTIFKAKTIPTQTANHMPSRYYASIQAGEKNGVPDVLAGDYTTMVAKQTAATLPAPYSDATSGVEVRWVIERVCNDAIMAAPNNGIVGVSGCDTLPPKVAAAGTDNKYKAIPLPPIPNFRVTIRVDVPNTNTATYVQGFVQ